MNWQQRYTKLQVGDKVQIDQSTNPHWYSDYEHGTAAIIEKFINDGEFNCRIQWNKTDNTSIIHTKHLKKIL